jgi:hypothetical protein
MAGTNASLLSSPPLLLALPPLRDAALGFFVAFTCPILNGQTALQQKKHLLMYMSKGAG